MYNLNMADRQAEIDKRIGISSKNNKSAGNYGRRSALIGLAGLGAATVVALGPKILREVEEARWDPTNPQKLKELLGKEGVVPYNYAGKVKINEGAVIYKEPHEYAKEEPGKIIGTYSPGNTELGSLAAGESLLVEDPFLFISQAAVNPEALGVIEIIQPDGQKVAINRQSIWVIFNLKDTKLPQSLRGDSPFGVGCVRVSGANVEFQSRSGEVSFFPKSEDIKFGVQISYGRIIP